MEEILKMLKEYNEKNKCNKKILIFPDGSGDLIEHTSDVYSDHVNFDDVTELYTRLCE